ncbi:hypothetical protein GOBAR_DD34005 [Gossypium barbadense]|nr:hypothetical protein GOBAR_DD34005 [Gossypium barbadense]
MATKENDQIIKENNCEPKMGFPCVLEAFTSIFETGSISNKCCGELVVLGKVCHSALVKRTLENPYSNNVRRPEDNYSAEYPDMGIIVLGLIRFTISVLLKDNMIVAKLTNGLQE